MLKRFVQPHLPSQKMLFALGLIAALSMLCALTVYIGRSRQARSIASAKPRAPATRGYVCARCARQALHSKRTLLAWEQGSRRFLCTDCQSRDQGHDDPGDSSRLPESRLLEEREPTR